MLEILASLDNTPSLNEHQETTSEVQSVQGAQSQQCPQEGEFLKTQLDKDVLEYLQNAIVILQRVEKKHGNLTHPMRHEHEATKRLNRLINALKSFGSHFHFLSDIINTSFEDEIKNTLAKHQSISQFYERMTKKNLCLRLLKKALKRNIVPLIVETEKIMDEVFVSHRSALLKMMINREAIDSVQIMVCKLEAALEYLPKAAFMRSDSIFAHKKCSGVWKKLYNDIDIFSFGEDKKLVNKQFGFFYFVLTLGNAMVQKYHELGGRYSLKNMIQTLLSGFYYGARMNVAERQAKLYLSEPKEETAFIVWNLTEISWIAKCLEFKLPIIAYDRCINIQRLFPVISKEGLLQEYKDGTLNKISKAAPFIPTDLSINKESILHSIYKKQKDSVRVRIISPEPLVLNGSVSEKSRAMVFNTARKLNQLLRGKAALDSSEKNTAPGANGIIIHVHGGGFVAGSSATHRTYLYQWAKETNKIVFSIDYRLAPENPYPAGLDDVWQAYNWIINYAEPILGIKTDNIVLFGDSAGGNLALALMLRAIKMGVRVPNGCLLGYPGLTMDLDQYNPEYFKALDDKILPYAILKLCLKSYTPEEFNPKIDPFLSPLIASDELLSQLPPMRIITGMDDPLYGDCLSFLHRLQNLKKDIKMTAYKHFPHGFLMFDQAKDYRVWIRQAGHILQELLDKKNSK